MVNDSIGHDAGDELLIGAARCIREAFSHLGDVFRIGGDEFTAILNCSKDEAEAAYSIFCNDERRITRQQGNALFQQHGMIQYNR